MIGPNLNHFHALHARKPHKHFLINVLRVLGESHWFQSWIPLYRSLLNSDQAATLVSFMEALNTLKPQALGVYIFFFIFDANPLQHLPQLICFLNAENPLIRYLCLLLHKHLPFMTPEICDTLFRSTSVASLVIISLKATN